VQNAVPPQDMGVATSSATFFRQMGGTLGHGGLPLAAVLTVGDRIARRSAPTRQLRLPGALKDPQVLADPTNRRVVGAITNGGGLPKGALDDTSFLSSSTTGWPAVPEGFSSRWAWCSAPRPSSSWWPS
jgi:hypothetical protein